MQNYKGLNIDIYIMTDWADQLDNSEDPLKARQLENIKRSIGESILKYLNAFGQIPQLNTDSRLLTFCDSEGEPFWIESISVDRKALTFFVTNRF